MERYEAAVTGLDTASPPIDYAWIRGKKKGGDYLIHLRYGQDIKRTTPAYRNNAARSKPSFFDTLWRQPTPFRESFIVQAQVKLRVKLCCCAKARSMADLRNVAAKSNALVRRVGWPYLSMGEMRGGQKMQTTSSFGQLWLIQRRRINFGASCQLTSARSCSEAFPLKSSYATRINGRRSAFSRTSMCARAASNEVAVVVVVTLESKACAFIGTSSRTSHKKAQMASSVSPGFT